MQAFLSIKGLFGASSRVAILANLRKLSWVFCFLLSSIYSIGQVSDIQSSSTGLSIDGIFLSLNHQKLLTTQKYPIV